MIVVTGAAGFIGSCLVRRLNEEGYTEVIVVDDFSYSNKNLNLQQKKISRQIHRDEFIGWLSDHYASIDFIFHIGARTDTAEFDKALLDRLNLDYSKSVWNICARHDIPLIYASSAATYGKGESGYDDNHEYIPRLQPLNPYGESKNEFDQWVLQQQQQPTFWAGLKFFNVYGPNEYHKERMASVIFHAYHQVVNTGKVRLFRSHHPHYEDGKQLRDFIYVQDVIEICTWLMHHRKNSGIYNVGTGKARTFLDLTNNVFRAMGKKAQIEFIDTPVDIRDKYQYFTEAKMHKLKSIGYQKEFCSLEDGIDDYVKHYLAIGKYY